MAISRRSRRKSDRHFSHTEQLKPPFVRFWEQNKVWGEKDVVERQRLEADTKYCCYPVGDDQHPCGKIAHYMVRRSGFCREDHQAEAYATQAEHWKRTFRRIRVKGE